MRAASTTSAGIVYEVTFYAVAVWFVALCSRLQQCRFQRACTPEELLSVSTWPVPYCSSVCDVSLRIVQDVLVGDSHGLLESRNNGLGLFKGNGRLIALSVWLRLGLSSRVTSETRLKAAKKEKEGDENEPAWDNCESGHGDGRRLLNLNGPRHGKSRSPLEVERGSSCASIRTPFGRWASYDIQHE